LSYKAPSGNFGFNPVHAFEHRYLTYAQRFAKKAHDQTWSLNDKACFLDSCILHFHATDMNAQLVACLERKDCSLVLQIFSRLGNLQCTGYKSTSESLTAGHRTKQPVRFLFIDTGSSIPVLGDACFILSVVGAGDLQ